VSRVRIAVPRRLVGALALAAAFAPVAPALAASPHLGSRVLREGMTGTDVRALQRDLTQAGFSTPAAGMFGPVTALSLAITSGGVSPVAP